MGVTDAPQWLVPSFTRSVVAVGATADPDTIRTAALELLERWQDSGRRFHNLRHLVDVLVHVDELVEETHEPAVVRLAAWYHGAVFDAARYKAYLKRGGEDEVASAVLAVHELTALGVPEDRAHRVGHLVEVLVRHSPAPGDTDAAVLSDADMAMLATEPQKYKTYLQEVRAEYAAVPVVDFLRARERIITKLLARKSIFHTPLSGTWEESARQNLMAERQRVERELATLVPPEASLDAPAATAAPGGSQG